MSKNAPRKNHTSKPHILSVVICDFNGWIHTRRCLQALRDSRFRAFDVIVVDHGTTGDTRNGLTSQFPEVTIVSGSPELWWTGATNIGIRTALSRGTAQVMLLNNDCYVDADAVGTLVAHTRSHPDAIIAPVQRDLSSGRYIAITLGENLLLGFATTSGPDKISPEMRARRLIPTRLIGGGRGVIIPSKIFAKTGLLDEEELPHYYADHDFYLRCRKEGISLCTAVDAEVAIDNAQTSIAKDMRKLNLSEFLDSLTSMRSHRSVRHLKPLFKKHYPIRHLYIIGIGLYLARYLAVYALARLRYGLGGG